MGFLPDRGKNGEIVLQATAFSNAGMFRFRGHGVSGTASKTTTTNIDHVLAQDRFINGVQLILKDHVYGDSVKFQVVHPTAGILDEFGTDWFVAEDKQEQGQIMVPYPASIPAGLTIRLVYNSVGTVNNVKVRMNLFLHWKEPTA